MVGLTGWLETTGAVVGIIATVLAILGTVGTFFKRSIGKMIDEKIDPIYRRLDEHMSSEDQSLSLIADAMKRLADTWQNPE